MPQRSKPRARAFDLIAAAVSITGHYPGDLVLNSGLLRVSLDDLQFHVVGRLNEYRAQAVRPARRTQNGDPFGPQTRQRLIQVVHADGDVIEHAAAIRRVLSPALPLPTVERLRVGGRIPEERHPIEL